MPLNISGSIVTPEVVREYEYNSIIQDGLVLHLDARIFNTVSGTTWYDFSGNSYHGTLTNGPTFSSSNQGSISFDGTNDTISVSKPNPNISGYISMCLWVKYDNYSSSPIVLHKGYHYTFQMRASSGTDYWTYADSSDYSYANFGYRQASGLYDAGNWMFLSITKDTSNDVRLYKNGVLLDTRTSFGSSLTTQNTTLWLSGYSDTDSVPTSAIFDGNLGQVLIYNRTLSLSEIQHNYNLTKYRYGL